MVLEKQLWLKIGIGTTIGKFISNTIGIGTAIVKIVSNTIGIGIGVKILVQWCPDLVYPDLVDCRDLVDQMPATELGHIISPLFRFSGLFFGPFYV